MPLKSSYATQEEVPEALREFYVEQNGAFVLSAEGMVSKDKLDEFRANNTKLMKEREELLAKYDGIDPEEARTLAEKALKLEEKRLADAGKTEELIERRVSAMRIEHEKAIKAAADKEAKLTRELSTLVIDNSARDAALKAGVRPTAMDDVLLRVRAVYSLQDGKAVPMDGDKIIYGKSGEPMDMAEYVSSTLAEKAPHLFEPSTGGGAGKGQPVQIANGRINARNDKDFLTNLDKIADGEVRVG